MLSIERHFPNITQHLCRCHGCDRGEGLQKCKTFSGLSLETQRDVLLFLVEEHLCRKILEKIAPASEALLRPLVRSFGSEPGAGHRGRKGYRYYQLYRHGVARPAESGLADHRDILAQYVAKQCDMHIDAQTNALFCRYEPGRNQPLHYRAILGAVCLSRGRNVVGRRGPGGERGCVRWTAQ